MRTGLKCAALHSSDSPEWYTPLPFVEAAREVMGGIDLDPASHHEANLTVRADRYYSELQNGLLQEWRGRIFLNPPGGLVNEFWCKLLLEVHVEQAVWIGYSLEQLQTLQLSGAPTTPIQFPICIPSRRIAFVENRAKKAQRFAKLLAQGKKPNHKSSPSHANYITYIGPNIGAFDEIFRHFGQVRA